jgi:putative endonuclease
MLDALARAKQMKAWHREWKINLIEGFNPHWNDLHNSIGFEGTLVKITPDQCH